MLVNDNSRMHEKWINSLRKTTREALKDRERKRRP